MLLVRGALADGDRQRAARLASEAKNLAMTRPDNPDMTAAAAHVRGLVEHDSAALEHAARTYTAPLAKAAAIEDAGRASSAHGNQDDAIARLRMAYEQYEKLGRHEAMARVRSQLRVVGVRVRHWKCANRPAFGWGSLTDTERRIAELVSHGLSNREVANQVFLSAHTVAFHLRHIFWKLDVGSRVQLARLVTEKVMAEAE
ncbi:MAG TPA: helix-turn-helix transcriptional regulator [Streptosporangiaceae bacterium]|nr:helix-turn-helix transcriptional regulator [Streptosporangiaceae bacterium]